MAASTSAPALRVFFCGDLIKYPQQESDCFLLMVNAFKNSTVFFSSVALSPEVEGISQTANQLAKNILNLHSLSVTDRVPQRFLVFTYAAGIRAVESALKEISPLNIDIHVYSFGGTSTLVSKHLASQVNHYVFQDHLNSPGSTLSTIYSSQPDNINDPLAVSQVALEQGNTNAPSRNEEYFDRHSVTLLVESPPELPDAHRDCEFLAYAKIIQKIAQCYYNTQD